MKLINPMLVLLGFIFLETVYTRFYLDEIFFYLFYKFSHVIKIICDILFIEK
jgi:hypothetical protein